MSSLDVWTSTPTNEPEPTGIARWASVLAPAAAIAERVANTEFVPAAMRNKPDVVTAAILYGDEIGVGPMQALQGIHIVEGRPQPSAELMRAMILRAGHAITVHEASGTRVRVSGIRSGRPESERVTVEWSLDMARSAGLLGRKNWQTHPRSMLMARATGDLARWLFPDVIKGLGYVAEDAAAEYEPPELNPEEEAHEPRKPLQRKRRPSTSPGPAPAPERAPVASDKPLRDVEDVPLPPLPDPEPEPGPTEPPPAGFGIGPGMLRGLHAALTRELGTVATREEKLAMCAAILRKPVESSKNLTPQDASRAIDVLGRIQSGSVAWEFDAEASADGKPVIRILYPEAPDRSDGLEPPGEQLAIPIGDDS